MANQTLMVDLVDGLGLRDGLGILVSGLLLLHRELSHSCLLGGHLAVFGDYRLGRQNTSWLLNVRRVVFG